MKRSLCLCLAGVICAPAAAAAQVVLEGRVIDDVTTAGLVSARVLLLDRYSKPVGYAVTDHEGRFHFSRRENGWYRLDVSAIGYRNTVTPLLWPMRDHLYTELEVRLAPHTVLLAPVEVIALSPLQPSPVLANVEHRRTRGFGVHLTRDQIEDRRPANVSDMLLELPGVYAVRRGSGSSGRVISMSRSLAGPGGGPCVVQIFLDGRLATRDVPGGDVLVDELVSPLDVEVIEVFRGLSSIPPEFLTPNARCGVIAIWTKRSTDGPQ
jgi:hypothetical protein